MSACHSMVQRILWEAMGIVSVDPRTTPIVPVLQPAVELDVAPTFADDGFIAGRSSEVLRALGHIKPLMPSLGLRFPLLEAVPSTGEKHRIDLDPFVELGYPVNLSENIEIMGSPFGPISNL